MAYYVGDIPAEDIVIEPARRVEGEPYPIPIDLSTFDDAEIILRDFDGVEVETSGFVGALDAETGLLSIEWPGESVFDSEGIYSLNVTLEAAGGARERLKPIYLVVQPDDGWHSLDSARDEWVDAPESDMKLYAILWSAKQEVETYAETLEEGQRPPLNYRYAQLMQARNLWNAAKVNPSNSGLGEESFVIEARPLDWMIKQVLRPRPAAPRIG